MMGFFTDIDESGPIESTPLQQSQPVAKKKGFFSDMKEEPSFFLQKPEQSRIPEMKHTFGRHGKIVASEVLGVPGNLASLGAMGAKAISPSSADQEKIRSVIENPFTSESIKNKIEEIFPSTSPQSPEEQREEEIMSMIVPFLIPTPAGKAKILDPRKRNALYQSAKNLGLTEKELAPLFHRDITTKTLGRLATKSKEAKKNTEMTKNALGNAYEMIKAEGRGIGKIPVHSRLQLENDLSTLRRDLSKTLNPSSETQSMINILEKAEDKLTKFGTDPEELINSFIDINKSINWNAVSGGKMRLAAVKNFYREAIHSSSPELAKKFDTVTRLWAKNEAVIRSLGRNKFNMYLEAAAATGFLGNIFTGDIEGASKYAAGYAGKRVLGKIAGKLLTDPKWQNINSKIATAIKNQSIKNSAGIVSAIQKKVKEEMPEEYDDIDWDQLK